MVYSRQEGRQISLNHSIFRTPKSSYNRGTQYVTAHPLSPTINKTHHYPPSIRPPHHFPPTAPTVDKAATSLPTHCTHGQQGRHITAHPLCPRSTRPPHHCPPTAPTVDKAATSLPPRRHPPSTSH